MPNFIVKHLTKFVVDNRNARAFRIGTFLIVLTALNAVFCYAFYLLVPSVQMAIGQFVCVYLVAIPNIFIKELAAKRLESAQPHEVACTIAMSRMGARFSWPDEDGTATAKCTIRNSWAPRLLSGKYKLQVFEDAKYAALKLVFSSLTLSPSSYLHTSTQPRHKYLNCTNFLILLNCLCYLAATKLQWSLMLKVPTYTLVNAGASLGVVDQPWRLLTSCFLHITWWHLVFNMLGLAYFGYPVEGKLGALRYLGLYIFCGLCGSVASAAAFGGTTTAAGASGAIMGLGGFLTALCFLRKDLYRSVVAKRILRDVTDIAVVALLGGLAFSQMMSGTSVDNAGHMGGFIAGVLGAFIFPRTDWRKRLICIVFTVIALPLLWQIAAFKYFEDGGHGARAILAMAGGDQKTAQKEYEQALAAVKISELPSSESINAAENIFARGALASLTGFDKRRKLCDIYNSLSWGESSAGRFDRGLMFANLALKYRPDDIGATDTRSMAYLGLGRYAEARADEQHCLKMDKDYGAAKFHLWQIDHTERVSKKEISPDARDRSGTRIDYDAEDWEYRFGRP